jgi:eukaryotic-like serine/threonine-protein kinase
MVDNATKIGIGGAETGDNNAKQPSNEPPPEPSDEQGHSSLPPAITDGALSLVGQTIDGRYELLSVLGQGGMGVVYEAIHVGTRKRAAVKLILGAVGAPKEVLARFAREAQATGSLNSEHIVQIYDTGRDEISQRSYMAMEMLVGETLSALIKRIAPVPEEVALRLIAQVLLGLSKAHEAGVVHRDIKPANIFIVQTDAGDRVAKILDFGIAKMVNPDFKLAGGEGLTSTGTFLGSPRYMAPEQMLNQTSIDHRADIWSVGVVLFQLLTGRTPHADVDSLGEIVLAVCSKDAPGVQSIAPWTSRSCAAIVKRALQRAPEDRYGSARAMLDDIRELLGDSLSISAKHMVALSAERRAIIAARLSLPPAAAEDSTASASAASASVAPSAPGSRRRMGVAVVAAAVGLAGVLLGVGVVVARGNDKANSGASETKGTLSAHAVPVASGGSPTTPSAALAEVRSVRLEVTPDEAVVEVDGEVVARADKTSVVVRGTLGSVHRVKVRLGAIESTTQVIVAESGAVPSTIRLDTRSVAKPGVSAVIKPKPAGPAATAPVPTVTGGLLPTTKFE